MVIRLQPPTIEDIEYTQTVIDQRQNGRNANYFAESANWWKERIEEYNREGGDPARIAESIISEEHKNKYINLYTSDEASHRQVQEIHRLRNRRRKLLVCPACGEDGTPRTLDHYLPKAAFPEFAVHLRNLIPMCDICQEIKGEEYLNEAGEKCYFHSYFDTIPNELFVIDISQPYLTPSSFTVRISAPTSSLAALALRHAKGLNLQGRIEDYCREKYTHLLRSVATNREGANIGVRTLLELFLNNEKLKTSNAWTVLFYRSVLADVNLMNWLASAQIPECYLP